MPRFKPSRDDKELMENVMQRLSMMGSLAQPAGTQIRSIPGATVKFLSMAGMVVAMVYADDDRAVGSITPDGQIAYVQPRS